MTEKRFKVINISENGMKGLFKLGNDNLSVYDVTRLLNELLDENEQLKKDVEYWKQVASQYSNELNVFEHCKKYKTECKDIYWSSD